VVVVVVVVVGVDLEGCLMAPDADGAVVDSAMSSVMASPAEASETLPDRRMRNDAMLMSPYSDGFNFCIQTTVLPSYVLG
jgi:hypothetical protein